MYAGIDLSLIWLVYVKYPAKSSCPESKGGTPKTTPYILNVLHGIIVPLCPETGKSGQRNHPMVWTLPNGIGQ